MRQFFVIFLSLQMFYVTVDTIQHLSKLPDSANIFVLFLFYDFCYAVNFMLPVSILLSLVSLLYVLIRQNEFIAFFSLGYSKKIVGEVFFTASFLIAATYVLLNATPFAYSKERLDSILNNSYFFDSKEGIFLKHKESYVYFGTFYPIQKKAQDIKVYEMENGTLQRLVSAKEAQFSNDRWILKRATVVNKPKNPILGATPLTKHEADISVLDGFRPKILDNIYEGDAGMSLQDAYTSIILFESENIDTKKARSILYSLIFFPFFAPFFGIFLIYFAPTLARFQNLSFTAFVGLLAALSSWGLFFGLSKLSFSGVILPELGIIAPIFVLCLASFVAYKKLIPSPANYTC